MNRDPRTETRSQPSIPKRSGHAGLRKGRYSQFNQAYFITKCVADRESAPLAQPECAQIVVRAIEWLVKNRHVRCYGFVIMPDHYHAIFGLLNRTLEQVMHTLNRYTAQQLNRILEREGAFWQEAYYEHAIRNRQDFEEIIAYMHENPVRAGLVERIEAWEFSSANPKYAHLIDWEWLDMR